MGKRIIPIIIFINMVILSSSMAENIVLENETVKAVFNSETGALEELSSKLTGWEIERRPGLALSFSMNVPLPDQRSNPVMGENQKKAATRFDKKENKVTFTWEKLYSEKGGELDITFAGTARLTEKGVEFTAQVDNRSGYVVETVRWPRLGDLSVPEGTGHFSQSGIYYGGMEKLELYPKFQNQEGYFGVDYPAQKIETPYTPFSLIGNEKEGLYVGYHDFTAEDMVHFKAELKPGYVSYELWDTGVNTTADTLAGEPARIEFSTVHFPFVNPGEKKELKPVVLMPYKGTWHKGADYYKEWRATWFKSPSKPAWLSDVHSWQQIHMNNPEDDIKYSYKDLLDIGKDCAKYGVKAIQVTGWTIGGQDRGNPSHDIDPRLGSWEDLKNTISEVQDLGVKIILFSKFTWADRSTDWYRNELYKFATKDPYGDPHYYSGYMYQTDVQLAGINTRRFTPMCHHSEEWREIADREFEKTLDLGADGMLFDENQHHGGTRYCFDSSHGHKVPAHIFDGDEILAKGFEQIKNRRNPDYIFGGEGNYDLEFRQYQVSYFRVDLNHVPIHRYVAPEDEMMIAISGYNDRNMINTALMYRYIFSYEPRNFKGRLHEYPMTMAYGRKVDSLRKRYKDLLWDGEFYHTVGAEVMVDGNSYDKYSVFRDKKTGKRAVVISNFSYDKPLTAKIKFEEGSSKLLSATPENPEAAKFSGTGTIPPNSALIVFEK